MSIELLAPAGNFECLKTALYFGADAVYVGGNKFGLRAFANNFDREELSHAVEYVHGHNKKIYAAVNSVVFNDELEDLQDYLLFLKEINIDGVIISDPAVLQIICENNIDLAVHLSTQANTTNYKSVLFWHKLGIKRIVLSRELSLESIEFIRKNTPDTLEIEAFVHGAMCVAHSGRCLLSSVLINRSGNRGECAQPCRWDYYIYEKKHEGQYFNILEDEKSTYIMNSNDLMMIEHIDKLAKAGICSFKIEGRMKSPYYVASVVDAYRKAIDNYTAGLPFDTNLKEELIKSASRPFCTGFYFGNPKEDGQDTTREFNLRKYTFVGRVLENIDGNYIKVEQRNKFSLGDTLEILSPKMREKSFCITEIYDEKGNEQPCAPHPQQIIKINCKYTLKEGDILRRSD